jgi:hypothetical protein
MWKPQYFFPKKAKKMLGKCYWYNFIFTLKKLLLVKIGCGKKNNLDYLKELKNSLHLSNCMSTWDQIFNVTSSKTSFCLLTNNSSPPRSVTFLPSPASDDHFSTLYLYQISYFRSHIWARLFSICLSVPGLFHFTQCPPGSPTLSEDSFVFRGWSTLSQTW